VTTKGVGKGGKPYPLRSVVAPLSQVSIHHHPESDEPGRFRNTIGQPGRIGRVFVLEATMVLAHLHRIDPDANMARFYCIDLAPTLFGEAAVLRRWGRIGTRGRASVETWPSAGEAEAAASRTLRQKSRRGYSPADQL
jgi:predicted DNA-binding WGR domain protein